MAKHNIDLPARIFLRNHNGEALYVTEDQLAPVLLKLVEVGAKTILTNVWNGGGKDATDAERLAALMKKLDAWKRGEFNVTERGESQYSAFKEVYLADCVAAGFSIKAAEDAIRVKVTERLGKDTKATFANFIEASAVEYADAGDMTRDEAREALEAYYAKESDRRQKELATANKKVEMPKLDLSAFKKSSE
jgi:plasmid stability protein